MTSKADEDSAQSHGVAIIVEIVLCALRYCRNCHRYCAIVQAIHQRCNSFVDEHSRKRIDVIEDRAEIRGARN